MAEGSKKYTELVENPSILDSDLLMTSKADGSASYKATVAALGLKIVNNTDYASDLETDSKKIICAINELLAAINALELRVQALEGGNASA